MTKDHWSWSSTMHFSAVDLRPDLEFRTKIELFLLLSKQVIKIPNVEMMKHQNVSKVEREKKYIC